MQQYYQSVCERQQQALRRNQALQQDVRRAHTSAASGVDTSQLELLKSQYQSSIASTYPHWLAQVNWKREKHRELQTSTSEGYNMPLSHKAVVASVVTTHVSTTYTTSAPLQGTRTSTTSHAPVTVTTSTVPVNTLPLLSTGSSPTQPLPRSKLGPTSCTTSHLPGSMQSHSSRQPDTLVAFSTPPLPAKITKSPVECSSSSLVCENSHTMHAVTEPSSVAVSKMEITEHVSHLKTHFEGEQLSLSTDLPAPVVTKRESLAMKCITESVPSFPTTSKHAVLHAEQPSHSTLLATEPTAILTPNKQMTDSSPNAIHVTIPPKHITSPTTTTHTLTQTVSAAVSSTSTSSSTQLPANTSLPPTLRNDPINSNLQQQPSTHFSITSTQPQSVLILSQEGSEPSLSQTETPLDLTDDDDDGKEGGKQACNNGTQNMNTGLVTPQERQNHDLVDSDHSDLESIDSLLPDNGLQHALVLDQRPTDAQAKGEHSSAKTKENSHRMGESIKSEHAVLNRGKDEGTIPVPQGEGEVDNPSDGSDSISDMIPSLSPLPKQPQQKLHVNGTSVIMDGSSSSTESQAELCKTRDKDRGVQTPLLDPKPQDGADAYATFLQSVCQTSAIDSSPLDSDSDGIDAILTGQRREQENGRDSASVSSHSAAAVESAVDEGIQSGIVTDRGREHHSSLSSGSNQLKVHTKRGGRERRDDASDSDSSQSVQSPSYVPTVVEKQSTSQSTLLKKRPGFWGSDDSLDGSDLADSPTTALAEDDKEDFDFHV